jgi:hypothetical protein
MALILDGAGTITGLQAGGLPDNSITSTELANDAVTTAKIADNAVTSAKYAISVARITDSKASGTDGGTFTSGAWRTRDLNAIEDDPDSIVTLSSNQFTLGAGTYLIQWSAPAFDIGRHRTQLWDVTGSTDLAKGTSEYVGTTDDSQTRSFGFDIVTLTASNAFEIQHRSDNSQSGNGFGVASSMAAEKYTMVTIFKLS